MIKYLFSYQTEKLHRYCFDVIYQQEHKIIIRDKFCIWLLSTFQRVIPDYREYLRKWHEDKKVCYLRYKKYEQ